MPEWILQIPANFWGVLSEMAPYLLLGFLVAGVLSVFISERFIRRHLGGRGLWPVVKSAAFGVPMPLCSCGVIPVSASLSRRGASRGATVSFLLATPQDGVDSILVTYSLLGGVFAIFRPLVAVVSGVIGGGLVSLMAHGHDSPPAAEGDGDEDGESADDSPASLHGKAYHALAYGFGELPRDIGKTLLVGLLLAALITAAVPGEDFFAKWLGGGLLSMLIMMAAGIPVYVCATASVPIAAALVAKGASPGAALVFLMTGPATNAATIATIWRVLGRKTTLIYLLTVVGAALGSGLLLDAIFSMEGVPDVAHGMWMMPQPVQWAAAAVLLGVLGVALIGPYLRRGELERKGQAVKELIIKGMTCSHCAANVRQALLGCEGVTDAEVDLNHGTAQIAGEPPDDKTLRQVVEEAGYTVEDIHAT